MERPARAKNLADRQAAQAKQYKTAELRATVEQLRERTERAGLLRRMSGAAAKDRAALAATRLQLADVERRTAEQVGALTTARDLALSDQADRHARENAMAREHLAERRPTFYAGEREALPSRAGNRAGGRGRDEDGGRERVHYRREPSPPLGAA